MYCHESKKKEFAEACVASIKESYGEDIQSNKGYSRIINEFHTKRLLDLAKDHGGKVLCGGDGDIKDKYVAPTVILDPRLDSKVMQEEIFGPILPIISYKDIQEVYDYMNDNEKPLAMYYFGAVTNNPIKDKLEKEMQAGMMTVNEPMVQAINHDLPFGGVGQAGYGAYHGIEGFKVFSNAKCVMVKPMVDLDALNKLILPPYTASDKKVLRFLMTKTWKQSHVINMFYFFILLLVLYIVYKTGLL